ncbi:MAG: LapA family protein [Gammaproteobacteria bacterium]
MSRLLKVCFFIVIIFLGLIFHLKNDQLVELNYYVNSIPVSFSLVIVLTLCIGALLGVLASLPMILKLKHENARLVRQVKMTEKEINNLRVIPVKDTL